jgi:hypothetical protein
MRKQTGVVVFSNKHSAWIKDAAPGSIKLTREFTDALIYGTVSDALAELHLVMSKEFLADCSAQHIEAVWTLRHKEPLTIK